MNNRQADYYLYTLGKFVLQHNNQVLSSGLDKINKQWKLLFFLLLNQNTVVSHGMLIKSLNLADNEYPRQSLRGLIYRLRQNLQQGKKSSKKIIQTVRRGYKINKEIQFWFDCQQFEYFIQQGLQTKDREQQLKLFYKAYKLFQAPFLEGCQVEPWLIEQRNKYRKQYLNLVQEYAKLLLAQKKYEQMVDVFETALRHYPYEVELHIGLYLSLKKAGRKYLAYSRAEESILCLQQAKLNIPRILQQAITDNYSLSLTNKPVDIVKKKRVQEKIFICGPVTFGQILDLEKRRTIRNKNSLYLVHYNLNGSNQVNQKQTAEKILKQVLIDNLRGSDILTRLKPDYFLQLFVNIKEKQLKKVMNRIHFCFQQQSLQPDLILGWEIEKL